MGGSADLKQIMNNAGGILGLQEQANLKREAICLSSNWNWGGFVKWAVQKSNKVLA